MQIIHHLHEFHLNARNVEVYLVNKCKTAPIRTGEAIQVSSEKKVVTRSILTHFNLQGFLLL